MAALRRIIKWRTQKRNERLKKIEAYHRGYGKLSGIPDCCIEFFVGDWENIWNVPSKSRSYHTKNGTDVPYIRCPKCIETNYIVDINKLIM